MQPTEVVSLFRHRHDLVNTRRLVLLRGAWQYRWMDPTGAIASRITNYGTFMTSLRTRSRRGVLGGTDGGIRNGKECKGADRLAME